MKAYFSYKKKALYFLESFNQQLGHVLNLDLVSWALAQVTPFGAFGFFFNTEKLVFDINLLRFMFYFY